MLSSLALFTLASLVSAAPLRVRRDVTLLPLGNTTDSVAWYLQAGNAGACGIYSQDTNLVVGLPLEFYNDTSAVSPYCGSYIILTNLANNMSVTAKVEDASATSGLLALSVATWRAVDGDGSDFVKASWRFATANETTVAALSSSSALPSTTTTVSKTAKSTYATVESSTYVAPVETTTSSSAWVESSSTSVWVAPTTSTSVWVAPTTSTSTWVAPTTTSKKSTTTSVWVQAAAAATTTATSSSSASSGQNSGQGTFFYQNNVAGACGAVNSDSAYIVALDSAIYDNGAYCGKSLTIWGNGKSVTATVADECPTCASAYSIDLSVAAFTALASEDVGVVEVTWSFN